MWCHNSSCPNLIVAVPLQGFPWQNPYVLHFNLTAEHRSFKVIKMQGTNIETQIPFNLPQMMVEQKVAYL